MKDMEIIDSKKDYKAPGAEVIEMNGMSVLCQSGNEPMNEVDYGNGGFSEE